MIRNRLDEMAFIKYLRDLGWLCCDGNSHFKSYPDPTSVYFLRRSRGNCPVHFKMGDQTIGMTIKRAYDVLEEYDEVDNPVILMDFVEDYVKRESNR